MSTHKARSIENLARDIEEIARTHDYSRRTKTDADGAVHELTAAVNALLEGVAARERQMRAQIEELRDSSDDAQTANKLLRHVKDELKSRKRQLDEAVTKAAAANTAKSQFLANMSHEIRTPMNGILGTAELLARTKLEEKQKKYVNTIIHSGRALLTIINDILDFSKVEAGKIDLDNRPFDLVLCITDVVALLTPSSARKQIGLSVDIEPGLPRAYAGDVGRVRQILTNIVGNSVKFTDKGHVKVALKGKVAEGRADLRIEVSDTGIGIPPERINDVFEKFNQVDGTSARRHEGTGLGLAICRSLVERMGGNVGLSSTLGVGSTFWFTLPLEVHEEAAPARDACIDLRDQKVLLMEPENPEACELRSQLERLGCEVAVAAAPTDLPTLVASRLGGEPLLLVLNIVVTNETLLRQVAELRALAPPSRLSIVICTTVGVSGDGKSFVEAGAQAYLSGRLSDDQLRDAIQDVLNNLANGSSRLVTRFSIGEERGPVQQGEASAAEPAVVPGRNKVLLVEDSLVNQEVARDFLESMGCIVHVARNGQEAVAALELDKYDIVLMDCQMPVMDGFQATRAIREKEKNGKDRQIPIVALTANAFDNDKEKCMAAGMTDFLSKPFMPDQFESTVRKWLSAH